MSDGWRRLARGIQSFLAHRQWVLALAVLAPLLLVTALSAGWQLDDHFHRSRILGYGDAQPLQIFVPYDGIPAHTQAQMDVGTLPWWASTDLHLAFLRYTSTLTALLDYQVWPDHPALMHLHSLLWLSAMVVAAAVLYRRILGATWVAGLAALLYAIDDAHAMPVVYLANRNALITTCFGVLSVVSYVDWCRRGRIRDAVMSALLLALALSAGEMAVATCAYLAAYVLVFDEGPLRTRLMRVAPHVAVFGAWALVYRLGGFGSQGSGVYLDPVAAPITFVKGLMDRAPLLLLGQWTPIPAAMGFVYAPGSQKALILRIESLLVVAVLIVLFFPLVRRDRAARFWALGMALSLLPISGAGPENRLLSFVGVGAMALVAQLVQSVLAGSAVSPSRTRRAFERTIVGILLFVHLCVAPVSGLASVAYQRRVSDAQLRAIASIPSDGAITGQDLVLVNPPDHVYVVTAIPVVKELDRVARPKRLRALSSGGRLRITRVGPQELRVEFLDGLFPTVFSRYMRSIRDPFEQGHRYAVPGLSANVEHLNPQADPDVVLYRFDVPLEDASLRWVRWQGGVYVPWTVPGEGESVELPAPRGIF